MAKETTAFLDGSTTRYRNRSTHACVRTLGTALGVAAAAHGCFEIRKGDQATDGHLVADIGAFTLIRNYRTTGYAAVVTGIAIAGWTLTMIRSRGGPPAFLLLSALSFLLGGGIAQGPPALLTWGVATRIGSSLSWWERVLPTNARSVMSRIWLPVLIIGFGLVTIGVALWLIVLPPDEHREIGGTHYAMWSILTCGLALLVAAIPCGFARDLDARAQTPD